MSRLARNLTVYAKFEQVVVKYDLELQTVVGGRSENNAMGRFMRGFDVLRAQMFSDELSEKTTSSMRALCTLGFYPLNPPLGLKRIKNANNRTILVRDEPKASVIYDAFAKYASGELGTKHDVTEFLRASGVFQDVKLNDTKVANMLKNEVYTGIFAYEHWGIERQEWQIDKLITVEVFNAVQARIQCNGRAARRSNNAADFPLAGLVCCEHCGHPMTGYYAKGYKGKLHPYYRCYNKECEFSKKSIRRGLIEDALQERLNTIRADEVVLELFTEVLKRVSRKQEQETAKQIHGIRANIKQLSIRISALSGALADAIIGKNTALVELYQGQIMSMTDQKKELEVRISSYTQSPVTEKFRMALARGREFFKNPGILWERGTLHQKKRLIRMLFLEKLRWNSENGFRTVATPWIFNKNTAQTDGESSLAAPTRFELVFSP